MDYAADGTLQHVISKRMYLGKPFDEHTIWSYLYCICQAIICAHRNKIIHRDIKPVSILIHKGVLKLCDFGISKKLDNSSQNAYTNTWSNIDYMSPEMLLGSCYSYSIDIWQLGIILYFMCTLKHPFRPRNMMKYQKNIAMKKILSADYKDIP